MIVHMNSDGSMTKFLEWHNCTCLNYVCNAQTLINTYIIHTIKTDCLFLPT